MDSTEDTIKIPQWLARALAPLAVGGLVVLGSNLRDSVLDNERRIIALEQHVATIQRSIRDNGAHRTEQDGALARRVSRNEQKIVSLSTRLNYHERVEMGYSNGYQNGGRPE